jgi:fumarate reductase subunit C
MKSLVRVGLRPSRNARLSFGVQLALVFFWLIYTLFLLFTESPTNDRHFVHYIFLAFALGYLIYILAQNTSLFGTQSYFEITPAYMVLKHGHFRPKTIYSFEDVTRMHLAPLALRLTTKDGKKHLIDLKIVSRRKHLKKIKEQLHNMALKFDIDLTEGQTSPYEP